MQQAYPFEAVRPWRTAAFVAAAIAAFELILLVVGGIVVFGPPLTRIEAPIGPAPTSSRTKPPPAPPRPPMVAREHTPVLVLNANGLAGAAAGAADAVRVRHYPVAGVGNAEDQTRKRSVVMYAPTFDREAERLAAELLVPLVSPLDGVRTTDLHGAKLVFLVGG